jgi:hypothetical protein
MLGLPFQSHTLLVFLITSFACSLISTPIKT